MAAPSCIFNPFSFQTSPQEIVFLLQMVSTALQFSHLSGLFLLLCLHILTPAKDWSSRDWFAGLLAIATVSCELDEWAGTTDSLGSEGSLDSR